LFKRRRDWKNAHFFFYFNGLSCNFKIKEVLLGQMSM